MSTKNKLAYSAADQRYWDKRAKELTFGRVIRSHRLAEEWSLVETAEKIGISKQQLSNYEQGLKLPSLAQAYRIAKALDMMPQGLVQQVINDQLNRDNIPFKARLAG